MTARARPPRNPYGGYSGPAVTVAPVRPTRPPASDHGVPEGFPHATTEVVLGQMRLPSYVWPTCQCPPR